MTSLLQDRAVVVTGATKGIGSATAVKLAAEGARVCLTGRDAQAGEAVAAEIKAAGGEAIFRRHSVASQADWDAVVSDTEAAFGPLRAVVNNAGAFLVKPLAETAEADFDTLYAANVQGCFLGCRAAFRAFARAGVEGAVVNVSSLMGQVGFPGATAYCATKGAVTALTKTAALEGARMTPQVRVNSLHPGVIWTPMITSQFGDDPALADAFAADTPLRIIGLPDYIADAVLYLVGDQSSYVTGAEIVVDGGRGAD